MAEPATARGDAQIVTFGCRMNAYESEVIRQQAARAGLEDAVIVNTCAVTGEAVRQARQAIRRLRRARPAARLIVTGCAAQIDPAAFAAMPEVDDVIGNAEKLRAESYVNPGAGPGVGPRVNVGDIFAVSETAAHLVEGMGARARAFVQIQTGCDHRCTFCVIPFGRGRSRSVPVAGVIAQARRLVQNGTREIVLTGVDLTAYGGDLAGRPSLGDLVRTLLIGVPELPRLRLSSVDPAEIDELTVRLLGDEPRLMPHLHLSLQAGDEMILKRMKRRHTPAQAEALVARLRRARPETVFGADLIAGFPTETDAMFAATVAHVAALGLVHLHVFPYSPRPGTPAARMPPVPRAVVKARAAHLRALGRAALARHLASRVGATESVLVEAPGVGRTGQFTTMRFGRDGAPGSVVAARVTGAGADTLVGTLEQAA